MSAGEKFMEPKYNSELKCKYCDDNYFVRPDGHIIHLCLHSPKTEYGHSYCNFIDGCYIRELLQKLEDKNNG